MVIGPEILARAEVALREREREIEAIGLQGRLLAGAPRAERAPRYAWATWLRALAARLLPPSEPECCLQPA